MYKLQAPMHSLNTLVNDHTNVQPAIYNSTNFTNPIKAIQAICLDRRRLQTSIENTRTWNPV